MSERNEILEEQRKAREEYLKLKKMQSGEIKAEPKPSEVAVLPKTPKEKAENFWFHYKWHTIAVIASIFFLAVMITQCANKTKYDCKIMYFTYTPVLDDQTEMIADYFEQFTTDINEDGEVNVQVINCSVSNDRSSVQQKNTMLTKLQAVIAAEPEVILYITDKDSIEFFDVMGKNSDGIFDGEPYAFSEKIYNDFYEKYSVEMPKNLQISLRKLRGTTLENDKTAKRSYEDAKKILEAFKSN